eukprot:8017368-Pyramimonas_sp.AAC.1
MHDARAIARQVRRAGFVIKPVTHATYLGIDFGCGRRVRATRVLREKKHRLMSVKIRRFTRATKQYGAMTKLQRQGGLPAGLYGHQ